MSPDSDADLIARLAAVSGHLVEDPDVLAEWAGDWSPLSFKLPPEPDTVPFVGIVPDSAADVAAILRIAADAGRPVVPKGGGSNTWGAIAATSAAILLDTRGLGVIGPVDAGAEVVVVDAGVIGGELEARLDEVGLTLGFDPGSLNVSTVGGWIATGATGHFSMRYGGIADLAQWVDAVLPTGEFVTQADPAPFVGSEGRAGVVTAAALRVVPAPSGGILNGWSLPDRDAALDAIHGALHAGSVPSALRLYDRAATTAFAAASELAVGGHLVVAAADGVPDRAEAILGRLGDALRAAGGVDLGPEPARRWFDARYRADWLLDGNEPEGRLADRIDVIAPWEALIRVTDTGYALMDATELDVSAILSQFGPAGATITFGLAVTALDDQRAVAAYRAVCPQLTAGVEASGGTVHHPRRLR